MYKYVSLHTETCHLYTKACHLLSTSPEPDTDTRTCGLIITNIGLYILSSFLAAVPPGERPEPFSRDRPLFHPPSPHVHIQKRHGPPRLCPTCTSIQVRVMYEEVYYEEVYYDELLYYELYYDELLYDELLYYELYYDELLYYDILWHENYTQIYTKMYSKMYSVSYGNGYTNAPSTLSLCAPLCTQIRTGISTRGSPVSTSPNVPSTLYPIMRRAMRGGRRAGWYCP